MQQCFVGYKCVIAGNFDCRKKCVSTRYQPFRFSTNGMSTCSLKKSYCSGEGQIIMSNGSSKSDRRCRCDYTQGYGFITKPEHGCYCVPSKEDCSCYKKRCPAGLIISPGKLLLFWISYHRLLYKIQCIYLSVKRIKLLTTERVWFDIEKKSYTICTNWTFLSSFKSVKVYI